MPLDSAGLFTSLLDIMNGTTPLPSSAAAGDAWGASYDVYAQTGTANGAPPMTTGAVAALKSALGTAFSTLPGSPPTVASNLATALSAYWLAVTFAGAAGPPIPTAGAALLISTLTAIFSAVGGTHSSKATEIRDALHAFTGSVIVPFPGPVTFPVV